MKKDVIFKFIIVLIFALFSYVGANAQSYTRSGNTFISSTGERAKSTAIETTFKVKEGGKEYVVYCSKSTGACFIKKISRNGNEYKKYLGEEISREVCKELNVEYKPRKKND